MVTSEICKICGEVSDLFERTRFRNEFDVSLWRCRKCAFLFAEPVTWLDSVYESPINLTDTGYVWRNEFAAFLLKSLDAVVSEADYFVDYGSGYGLFVRMMRDRGFKFHWLDPYCENLFARGFEAKPELVGKYRMATAFEVFEHVSDPVDTIREIASLADAVLFSTELIPDKISSVDEWSYFGLEHGQHISFYTQESLHTLARTVGWKYTFLSGGWHYFGKTSDVFEDPLRRIFGSNAPVRFWGKVRRKLFTPNGRLAPDPNAGLLQSDYRKMKALQEKGGFNEHTNIDLSDG